MTVINAGVQSCCLNGKTRAGVFLFVFLYAFQAWFFWNSKTVIQIIQTVSVSACHEPFISIVLACNQSYSLEGVQQRDKKSQLQPGSLMSVVLNCKPVMNLIAFDLQTTFRLIMLCKYHSQLLCDCYWAYGHGTNGPPTITGEKC